MNEEIDAAEMLALYKAEMMQMKEVMSKATEHEQLSEVCDERMNLEIRAQQNASR